MSILLLVAPRQNVIYAHVIIQNFESKTLFCTQIGFSSLLGVSICRGIGDSNACFKVVGSSNLLLPGFLFHFVDGTACCFLGRFNEIILKRSH